MKTLILSFLASVVLLASCNQNSAPAADQVPIVKKEINSEVNKTVANLTIEGMTCSAGCGGKIQQELRALQGVTTTDLEFEEGRPQNIVSVEYDPDKLTEQQLIQCVNGIADSKYTVKSVEILKYHGLQSQSSSGPVSIRFDAFSEFFQVLNLLESAAKLIH